MNRPFAGITLTAAAGILAAECIPASAGPLAFALFLPPAALAFAPNARKLALLLGAAAAFFALHGQNQHRHPSIALHDWIAGKGGTTLVAAQGVVADAPRGHPDFPRFPLRVERLEASGKPVLYRGTLLVRWRGPAPRYGDRIRLVATAANLAPARNPGEFDHAGWQARRGIRSELRLADTGDGEIVSAGHGWPPVAFALEWRERLARILQIDLPPDDPETAVIRALLLGLCEGVDPEMIGAFRQTGTLHLFAVSGLHVGMVAVLFWALLRLLPISRSQAALLILPMLWLYALVTGLGPSVLRATLMASVITAGIALERQPDPANSLAAAALLLLGLDTQNLFMAGFQLSFAVTGALLLWAKPLSPPLVRWFGPDPLLPRDLYGRADRIRFAASQHASSVAGVSLAAWIGSLPFTLGYFRIFTPVALAANFAVVPLSFFPLALGFLSILAAPFGLGISGCFNCANWLVTRAMLAMIGTLAQLPGGHANFGLPKDNAACRITALDLGAGGSILVQTGGRHWAIDAGSAKSAQMIVAPAFRHASVNRLDGLVCTHGDAAHLGGGEPLLAEFMPRSIFQGTTEDRSITRRALHASLSARGAGTAYLRRGDHLALSPNAGLEVLYPPRGLAKRLADDECLVLRLHAGSRRILVMSDAGFFTERWLLEHEPDLWADALFFGRHAADPVGHREFLRAVSPRLVVLTADDFPETERVPPRLLEAVADIGAHLLRMDETGAVTLRVGRDNSLRADGFLGGNWRAD